MESSSLCSSTVSIASLFSTPPPSSLSSVAIYPPSCFFFPSDAPTLSFHFIFLQFSAPFLLFLACRSSRCHQVFCRQGKEEQKRGARSGGHRRAPGGHESLGWQHTPTFFRGVPVHHSPRRHLIDARNASGGIPRMDIIPEGVTRSSPTHPQVAHRTPAAVWFQPDDSIRVSPAQTLRDPQRLAASCERNVLGPDCLLLF